MLRLLEFIDDVVDKLDSRKEIEYIQTILASGAAADNQLEIYREKTT